MVILLLSTVTFDGLSATPAWSNVQSLSLDTLSGTVNNVVFNGLTIADTIGLALIPVAFLLVYLAFSYLMAQSVDSVDVDNESGAGELARAFVYPSYPLPLPTTSPTSSPFCLSRASLSYPWPRTPSASVGTFSAPQSAR